MQPEVTKQQHSGKAVTAAALLALSCCVAGLVLYGKQASVTTADPLNDADAQKSFSIDGETKPASDNEVAVVDLAGAKGFTLTFKMKFDKWVENRALHWPIIFRVGDDASAGFPAVYINNYDSSPNLWFHFDTRGGKLRHCALSGLPPSDWFDVAIVATDSAIAVRAQRGKKVWVCSIPRGMKQIHSAKPAYLGEGPFHYTYAPAKVIVKSLNYQVQ